MRRTSVAGIARELWDSRELIEQFVRRDVTVKYTQAVFGLAWALLMPVLIVFSGLLFRFAVGSMSGRSLAESDVLFLAVKSLPWAFFAGALGSATQSVLSHSSLIGKVYFARESLPVASVIAQGLDSLIAGVALLLVWPFLGGAFSWTMLWGPAIIVLLLCFTFGCALMLSCANLFFRDVKYIVQVVLSFGLFATPILIEPQMLGARGADIMLALPMSPFIQGIGLSVGLGHNLTESLTVSVAKGAIQVWSPWYLAYAAALGIGTLVAGLRVFRNFSSRFAENA